MSTVSQPTDLLLVDVNADGRADLVTTRSSANVVSVFRSNGDGTFAPRIDSPTGPGPTTLASGDMNADGKLDLVSLNLGVSTFSVLIGNGAGGFTKTDHTGVFDPRGVAIGDVNGDGHRDIAIASHSSDVVWIIPGVGGGALGTRYPLATGDGAGAVAIADLNDDGRSDLAVTNSNSHTISVRLQDAGGALGAKVDYGSCWETIFLAVRDLDHDGHVDLVSAGGSSNFSSLAISKGNGDGTFGTRPPGGSSSGGALADFDEDGHLDLCVVHPTAGIALHLGQGDGTFDSPTGFPSGQSAHHLAAGDLDGDANLDLVTVGFGNPTVLSLHRGNGNGTFAARVDVPFGSQTMYDLTLGDIDGDGRSDVAVAKFDSGTVSVLIAKPDGTLGPRTNYVIGNAISLAIGDLNGDGRGDLASATYSDNSVHVLYGQADGSLLAGPVLPAGDRPWGVAIADFDHDGKRDLVVSAAGGTYSIWKGQGDGTFGPDHTVDVGEGGRVVVGDVNADGDLDLVITQSVSSVFLGAGDGTFVEAGDFGFPKYAQEPAIGDLNGDGRADVFVPTARWEVSGESSAISLFMSTTTCPTVGVDLERNLRGTLELLAPRPNPTAQGASVTLRLPTDGRVVADVVDVTGRIVRPLLSEHLGAGAHELRWDGAGAGGSPVRSGIYFIRVRVGAAVGSRTVAVFH